MRFLRTEEKLKDKMKLRANLNTDSLGQFPTKNMSFEDALFHLIFGQRIKNRFALLSGKGRTAKG